MLLMHGEVTKKIPMLPQKLMFGRPNSATTTHALMRTTNTSSLERKCFTYIFSFYFILIL
jgi:hypothetical protein